LSYDIRRILLFLLFLGVELIPLMAAMFAAIGILKLDLFYCHRNALLYHQGIAAKYRLFVLVCFPPEIDRFFADEPYLKTPPASRTMTNQGLYFRHMPDSACQVFMRPGDAGCHRGPRPIAGTSCGRVENNSQLLPNLQEMAQAFVNINLMTNCYQSVEWTPHRAPLPLVCRLAPISSSEIEHNILRSYPGLSTVRRVHGVHMMCHQRCCHPGIGPDG